MSIALITPTGARKDQFALCQRWMKRQTYTGEVLWIIVDDAVPVTTDIINSDFRKNWTIVKIYPNPKWSGSNTQARNIKAGTDYLKQNYTREQIQCIFIIEDDDYYKVCYLEAMMAHLKNYWMIGETNTIYYNVLWRRFVVNPNRHHASLFQTAFTWDVLSIFEASFKDKFIDAKFWTMGRNKNLFFDNVLAVGMKGMPGRGGIGAGHRISSRDFSSDHDFKFLTKIIGNDSTYYARYYRNNGKSQQPLFIKRSL